MIHKKIIFYYNYTGSNIVFLFLYIKHVPTLVPIQVRYKYDETLSSVL